MPQIGEIEVYKKDNGKYSFRVFTGEEFDCEMLTSELGSEAQAILCLEFMELHVHQDQATIDAIENQLKESGIAEDK